MTLRPGGSRRSRAQSVSARRDPAPRPSSTAAPAGEERAQGSQQEHANHSLHVICQSPNTITRRADGRQVLRTCTHTPLFRKDTVTHTRSEKRWLFFPSALYFSMICPQGGKKSPLNKWDKMPQEERARSSHGAQMPTPRGQLPAVGMCHLAPHWTPCMALAPQPLPAQEAPISTPL